MEALSPLRLLMDSASWLTARLAAVVETGIRTVHHRLAAGGDPVDLASFWFACLPVLHGTARTAASELQQEFAERWQRILAVPDDARRVTRRAVDIEESVRREFEGGGGWTAARYLSPDVIMAADGPEAAARGDLTLVLGELHLAANTLGASLFTQQHPDVDELFTLTDQDRPGPRLMPLIPKEHRARALRPRPAHAGTPGGLPGRPHRLHGRPGPPPRRPQRRRAGRGTGRSPRGPAARRRGPPRDRPLLPRPDHAVDGPLPAAAAGRPHTHRGTVDRLVIAREAWQLPAAEATFADDKDEARRFVRARHWRTRLGLPRFVFVVSPTESRPFYVDFDSPVYVTILAKALRRLARKDPSATATFTEMLPTPEQTWLTDDEGHRYTSELRFVAFDTRGSEAEGAALACGSEAWWATGSLR